MTFELTPNVKLREAAALAPKLLVLSMACLIMVALTHVCERYHLIPWMGWGQKHSLGHYLDLFCAVVGLMLLPVGLLLRVRKIGHPHSQN